MNPDYPPMRTMSPVEARARSGSHARWSQRTHPLLSVFAGLLMVGSVVAVVPGDDFYWVDQMLPSWFWLFSGTLLLLAMKSFDEQRGQPGRWVPTTMAVITAAVLMVGLFFTSMNPSDQVDARKSPDGRLTVVITEGAAMIDTVWDISIHQNNGLLSRQWRAGCLNGDDPTNEYDRFTWTGPTTAEIRTGGGERLRLSLADNGRPLSQIKVGTDVC